MKKTGIIAVIAGALLVAGGGTAMAVNAASTPAPVGSTQTPDAASTPSTSSTPSSTPAVDVTAAGEVCDPHNLNDIICLAFYPDIAVVNMTSGLRAQEPLRSMTDQKKIDLAHKACDAYAAGDSATTTTLVATILDKDKADIPNFPVDINNTNIFKVGALAYCNKYIDDAADGTDFAWTLNAYRSMGEQSAKESFAGGKVIQRP